jgi:hypothetical protein
MSNLRVLAGRELHVGKPGVSRKLGEGKQIAA